MEMEIFERYESEVRSYCRNFPVVFKKAKGSFMYDENGREYIDFFCGAGALNFGHNHPYIKEKVIEFLQNDGLAHALDMYTVAKREFIEKFQSVILAKRGLDYKLQFTGPTGTNAVEAALKLARKAKKNPMIFALTGAFHGMTLGALALTSGRTPRGGAGVTLGDVVRIPSPAMYPDINVINYLIDLFENDHCGVDVPAAIIIETVQAEGGVYPLGDDFLKALRAFCDRYGILLIVDDIQAGICRCGPYFSFESAGIAPDIVALSKSLGGYGFPMSVLLIKPELDLWKPGEHSGTFRGNQTAFVAASAALDLIYDCDIENEVGRKSAIISEYLKKNMADKAVAIRGAGMMYGVEFSDRQHVERIQNRCFENGLIIERVGIYGRVLKIMPPLLIEDEILIRGLEVIKKSLDN